LTGARSWTNNPPPMQRKLVLPAIRKSLVTAVAAHSRAPKRQVRQLAVERAGRAVNLSVALGSLSGGAGMTRPIAQSLGDRPNRLAELQICWWCAESSGEARNFLAKIPTFLAEGQICWWNSRFPGENFKCAGEASNLLAKIPNLLVALQTSWWSFSQEIWAFFSEVQIFASRFQVFARTFGVRPGDWRCHRQILGRAGRFVACSSKFLLPPAFCRTAFLKEAL